MKKYLIGITVLAFLLIGAVFLRFQSIASAVVHDNIPAVQARNGIPVRVSKPQVKDLSETIELAGVVEAVREASVNARVSEEIASSALKLGAFFPRDTVVVVLRDETIRTRFKLADAGVLQAQAALEKAKNGARPEEIAQAKSIVAAVQARFQQTETEFNRMNRLQQAGAISDQKSEQITSAYESSSAQLAEAKHRLSLLQSGTRPEDIKAAQATVAMAKANLELAGIEVANTMIKTPIAGFIARIYLKQGEETERGKPVFDIVDLDELFLVVDVPETLISSIKKGQSAECVRYDSRSETFTGVIDEISPRADPVSKTFQVKIRLSNPDHQLRPGMLARAVIHTEHRGSVIMIPQETVVTVDGRNGVFIADGETADFREIRIGLRQREMVEVSDGLSANDRVVVSGQRSITDGDRIAIQGADK